MRYSTLTKKGQTTIPGEVREALGIKPGDRLEYELAGDRFIVRVHPGTGALKGALASSRGKGLSFAHIREAATEQVRRGTRHD